MLEGIGKLHRNQAKVRATKALETPQVKLVRSDKAFQERARCEVWFALDGASLELYDLAMPQKNDARLAFMWCHA